MSATSDDRQAEAVGYPYAMTALATELFRQDHPVVDRNVFLMMRFEPSPLRTRIHTLVGRVAEELGFDLVRADDRDYSGELWTNVKLCLDNSSRAIAIFDDGGRAAENLAVELGYMFARDVPCLILREEHLEGPPAMLSHRLHTPFTALDLEGTLVPAIRRWLAAQTRRVDPSTGKLAT